MVNNFFTESISQEYSIDNELLIECIASACRTLYGIIEIVNICEDSIDAYDLTKEGLLKKKIIKISQLGRQRIVKETIKEITKATMEDKSVLEMLSYSSVIDLLEADIFSISRVAVKFKVISSRPLSQKEIASNPEIKIFVVVRASRYLNKAESRYFRLKAAQLKQGVKFVLD